MVSLKSSAAIEVGIAESVRFSRRTSAAAFAAVGASTQASARAANTAKRGRDNGASVKGWGYGRDHRAGLVTAGADGSGRGSGRQDPVRAAQHTQRMNRPATGWIPLGCEKCPSPLP